MMVKQLRKRLRRSLHGYQLRNTFTLTLAFALAFHGCSAVSAPEVIFTGRPETFNKKGPFELIVGIDGRGDLTLNRIDTGNVADISELTGKLGTVFEDRRRLEIHDRQIVIEMDGRIARSDLELVIGSLQDVGVSQITVVSK